MSSLVGKQSHASNLNVSAADGTFRVWGLTTLFIEIVERHKMNFKMGKKNMSLNILSFWFFAFGGQDTIWK